MLHAIIRARFPTGVLGRKVRSGEYEILSGNHNHSRSGHLRTEVRQLFPGDSISMCVVVGRYVVGDRGRVNGGRCPRQHCGGRIFDVSRAWRW